MASVMKSFKSWDTTSPEEKKLIAIFFRHRFNSFIRAAEEKIRMNAILYRGSINKATAPAPGGEDSASKTNDPHEVQL